jgi:hypothetical protein
LALIPFGFFFLKDAQIEAELLGNFSEPFRNRRVAGQRELLWSKVSEHKSK